MNAKSVAVRLLARREHSVEEMRQKLSQREFDESEIEQALLELEQGGWISDERFTEAYIRMRQLKGFGPIRIRNELRERGVSGSLVEQYLMPESEEWDKLLHEQYQKKYAGTAIDDYNEKAKRIRFLQYRGFSLESIYNMID